MSNKKDWFARLRHEWTKNDGKPKEAWAPGRDLKETVAIGALTVLTSAHAAIVAVWVFG